MASGPLVSACRSLGEKAEAALEDALSLDLSLWIDEGGGRAVFLRTSFSLDSDARTVASGDIPSKELLLFHEDLILRATEFKAKRLAAAARVARSLLP